MKLKFSIFLLVIVFVGCNTVENKELVGTWELKEFTVIKVNQKTSVSDEDELEKEGAIWDMNLKGNGKFKQEFNMQSPNQVLETETGNWYVNKDTLFVQLENTGTQLPPMKYTYKFENDRLVLTMSAPRNLGKLITKFSKK